MDEVGRQETDTATSSPKVSQRGEGSSKNQLDPPAERAQFPRSWCRSSPAVFLGDFGRSLSIFCQGKTHYSCNSAFRPNSSRYCLPFSSAELQPATAGTPGGTTRDEDSPSTATPKPCGR